MHKDAPFYVNLKSIRHLITMETGSDQRSIWDQLAVHEDNPDELCESILKLPKETLTTLLAIMFRCKMCHLKSLRADNKKFREENGMSRAEKQRKDNPEYYEKYKAYMKEYMKKRREAAKKQEPGTTILRGKRMHNK